MSVNTGLQRSIIIIAAIMQFFKDLSDRLPRKPKKRTSKKTKDQFTKKTGKAVVQKSCEDQFLGKFWFFNDKEEGK